MLLSPQKDLAKLIDDNFLDLSKLTQYILQILSTYQDKNVGAIVLGCTHYIFLKDIIKDVFCNVKLYDGVDKLTQEVGQILKPIISIQNGEVILKNSLNDDKLNDAIKNYIKSL